MLIPLINLLDPIWIKQAQKNLSCPTELAFRIQIDVQSLRLSITLELCDLQGNGARISNREQVRYRQDNFIAFQVKPASVSAPKMEVVMIESLRDGKTVQESCKAPSNRMYFDYAG